MAKLCYWCFLVQLDFFYSVLPSPVGGYVTEVTDISSKFGSPQKVLAEIVGLLTHCLSALVFFL